MEEPDPDSGPTAGVMVSAGIPAAVSQAPPAFRPPCPKRRPETARCPTLRTRGQKGLRQRLCPPQPEPLPLLLKGRS